MDADAFAQGPIIRLIIAVIVVMFLFFVYMIIMIKNVRERRRARREGLPVPPDTFGKLVRSTMGLFRNLFSPDDDEENPEDLPVPDFDFSQLDAEPESAIAEARVQPRDSETVSEEIALTGDVVEEDDMWEDSVVADEPERGEMIYIPGSGELPLDAVEVMRVWRDINDGALIIQMGDQLFRAIPEIRDRGIARRFIAVVQNLAQLATLGAAAAGLPTPNFEVTSGVVSRPGAWAQSSPAKTPSQSKPSAEALPNDTPPAPVDTGSLGIAAQIDRLLQLRLSQTPVFRDRTIQMGTKLDGSLKIQVDDDFYESIDEIKDHEVRDFIQQVVREWEHTR
ncbi:MAG: hypothetical protein L0154_11530 [Chloroflexi bacterium]|nr:hypothetical protein [Chloroflexota bacterium]